MALHEEYPKTNRHWTKRLREKLVNDATLSDEDRIALSSALNDMADKAVDLNEIIQRIVEEPLSAKEIGELLIAVELTTEQLRGDSDVIDGKLYDIGDRLVTSESAQKIG